MPSKSKAQSAFFRAAAYNPQFAAKAKVPVGVAQDFVAADKAAGKFQGKGKAAPTKPTAPPVKGRK